MRKKPGSEADSQTTQEEQSEEDDEKQASTQENELNESLSSSCSSEVHNSNHILEIDEYLCPACGKGYSNSYNKTIQQLMQNDMIACDVCNRWYHLTCCSDEIYNSEQTGNLHEIIRKLFRKTVQVVSFNKKKQQDCNVSTSFRPELELKSIQNKIKDIPFFVCPRCTSSRQLDYVCDRMANSANVTNNNSKISIWQDDPRDPFLFYYKYKVSTEEVQEREQVYYVITKANNPDLVQKFSYCNFIATQHDPRFIPTSKIILQQMSQCSETNLRSAIERTIYLDNHEPERVSVKEFQERFISILRQNAAEEVRPELEAYILLRVSICDEGKSLCECIGYLTCSFEFSFHDDVECDSQTTTQEDSQEQGITKHLEIIKAKSVLRQLFIGPKFRKKGHAQKLVKFFFNISRLLHRSAQMASKYQDFTSICEVEYPNYAMCCLLCNLKSGQSSFTRKIETDFDWQELMAIKEKYRKYSPTRKSRGSDSDLSSSDGEFNTKKRKSSDDRNPKKKNAEKPNVKQAQKLICLFVGEFMRNNGENTNTKVIAFVFKTKQEDHWRLEIFLPEKCQFDLIEDTDVKVEFQFD